jgi:hypothetical protein
VSGTVTYVGRLWGVSVPANCFRTLPASLRRRAVDGAPEVGDHLIEVPECSLGVVEGEGIVVASSRRELARGQWLAPAHGARRVRCSAVYYERDRPEGREWYHETPGAWVEFSPGYVTIDSKDATRCSGAGDFLCNAGDL